MLPQILCAAMALGGSISTTASPKFVVYVGTERVGKNAHERFASASREKLQHEADVLGFGSRVAGDCLVVWDSNSPILKDLEGFSKAIDGVLTQVKGSNGGTIRLDKLDSESARGMIGSMPWALDAMPGASMTVTPSISVRLRKGTGTIQSRFEPNPREPLLGFQSPQGGKPSSQRGFLDAMNEYEYVRVAEVLLGKFAEGRKFVGPALEIFDKEVDKRRSVAERSFQRLFEDLASSEPNAGLEKELSHKSLSEMSSAGRATLKGDLLTRWQSLGFASRKEAERYLAENPDVQIFPAINFGVRFSYGKGEVMSGYFELIGQPSPTGG